MATLASLFVELGLDPKKFNQGVDQAENKLKQMGSNFRKIGLGMTAAFTAPAIGIGKKLLDIGSDYDAMTDAIVTKTGASGDALKGLQSDALAVFKSIPTSMDLAGQAVASLSQLTGQTGQGLQDLAKSELELARITGADLGTTVETTAQLFNQWGVAMEDQVGTLDKLFRASQASGVPVDTLAQELDQYGPILRQMGFGLDESTALLATLGKSGLDAGTVVTGLRTAFKKFADEGLTDTNAALTDVFTQIQNAPDDLAAGQIAIDTFGSRAGPALAESIRTGKLSYEDLLTAIETGDTTILGTAENTNDLAEKWQIFKNQITVAVLPAATKLFDLLNKKGIPFLQKMAPRVQTLVTWFSHLPKPIKSAALVLGLVLAALGPILVVIGTLIPAISALGAVFAVLTGPIGLIILAIVLLAIAWKKNLFDIQGKTKAFIDFITPAIDTLILLFGYLKDVISGKIQPGDLAKLPGWLQPIALVLGRITKTLRVFFKTWSDKGFLAAMKTIPAQIRAFARAVSNLLAGVGLTHFADAFKKVFYDISHVVNDVITLVDALIHGHWGAAWDAFKDLAHDAIKLFIDNATLLPSLLLDIFNKIDWGAIGTALLNGLTAAGTSLVTTGITWLVTKGGELISGLLSGAQSYWTGTVVPWLEGLAASALAALPDLLTTLAQKGTDLLTGLYNAASTYWTGTVVPWLTGIGAQAVTAIGDMLTTLYQKGVDLFTGLSTGITDTWAVLSSWITTVPGLVVDAIADVTTTLYQKGVDLFVGMWNGILFVWDTLSDWIASVPSLVVTAIGDVTQTLYGKGQDLLIGLMNGIRAIWSGGAGEGGGIYGWLSSFWFLASSAIGDLSGTLWNAGYAVMQGLYNGILWGWNNLVAPLLNNISGWIPDWKGPPARDKKLLVNAGELIMGGLGVGLDRGWQDVRRQLSNYSPQVTGAASVATTANMPRLAPMPAVAGRGGADGMPPIIVNLNVEGNIRSENEFTVAVAKKLGPALVETFRDVRRARGMAT